MNAAESRECSSAQALVGVEFDDARAVLRPQPEADRDIERWNTSRAAPMCWWTTS